MITRMHLKHLTLCYTYGNVALYVLNAPTDNVAYVLSIKILQLPLKRHQTTKIRWFSHYHIYNNSVLEQLSKVRETRRCHFWEWTCSNQKWSRVSMAIIFISPFMTIYTICKICFPHHSTLSAMSLGCWIIILRSYQIGNLSCMMVSSMQHHHPQHTKLVHQYTAYCGVKKYME